MKKETLNSLSLSTGYSISTISRVLAGKGKEFRISPTTIHTILQKAEECNYSPNLLAKGLRIERSFSIGLIIPNLSNSYFSNIASIILKEAQLFNYHTIIIDTQDNEANERSAINRLTGHHVDGLIVVPTGQDPEFLEEISKKIPLILVDRYFPTSFLPFISTDNYQGAFDATELLISQGHTNILCIQGERASSPNQDRIRGYKDALKKSGLGDRHSICGNSFSIQNGYHETQQALLSDIRPSAIFTLSNTILLGSIKAIKEAGLVIPDDISIISFDNEIYLDFFAPAITRINQPTDKIGSLAVRNLMQKIDHKETSNPKILLPATIHLGGSVRPFSDRIATYPAAEPFV